MESPPTHRSEHGRVSMSRVRFFLMSDVFGQRADEQLMAFSGTSEEREDLRAWIISKRDGLVSHLEFVDDPVEVESVLATYHMALKAEWSLLNSRMQYGMLTGEFDEKMMYQLSLLSLVVSGIQLLVGADDVEFVNDVIARPLARQRKRGLVTLPTQRITDVLENLKDLNYGCINVAAFLRREYGGLNNKAAAAANGLDRALNNLQNCIIRLNESSAGMMLKKFESIAKEVLQHSGLNVKLTTVGAEIRCQTATFDAIYDASSVFFRELLLRLMSDLSEESVRVDELLIAVKILTGRLQFEVELKGEFNAAIIEGSEENDVVMGHDVGFAINNLKENLSGQDMQLSLHQTQTEIRWSIVSKLNMAVEGILVVDSPQGKFGLHQYLVDRILQSGQVREQLSGGGHSKSSLQRESVSRGRHPRESWSEAERF
ncbi:MAG: hypothetical protein MK080_06290 [Opitutales bacterium]|nr:hypothetical protein [Opitutales bacterium]NRA27326.1 hypothetical protein [Opitutales bacterium]